MRNLGTNYRAALAAGETLVALIVEIDYPTTPLRLWSGPGSLTWDSKTWLGVGDLGGISAYAERAALESPPLQVEMSGIPVNNRTRALAESSQRRIAQVWCAMMSIDESDVWSVIDTPWRVRRGYTDVHSGRIGAKTMSLACAIESPLARLRAANPVRLTYEEQQRLYPGDTSMRWAATIGDEPVYWGSARPSASPAAAPSNDVPSAYYYNV